MIKNILVLGLVGVLVMFWGKSLHARFGDFDAQTIDGPVVIELFTSQSCSSCPPADKNLGELTQNPNVIALSFHVTYWNYLHWKDTLSHQFSTDRQRAYAAHIGKRRVYTPQMIVNGSREFVGSRGGDIANALENARPLQTININIRDDGTLSAQMPELEHGEYTIWIAGIKAQHQQNIKSGENGGKTVTYHNAVIEFTTLGEWDGHATEKKADMFENTDIDRYVVLAQKSGYGFIAAAGQSPL